MFMLNRFVSSCAASALIRLEGPLGGDDFGGPLPPWSWAGLQSEPDAVYVYGEQNGLLTVEGPFDSPLGTQSGQRPHLFLIRVPLN